MSRAPSSFAPTPSLLVSLQRAGWGELAGREFQGVRSTLHALAALLPHKSAQGAATAEQVAAGAGLSERWVRRCLHVLEDLGIISWSPGGVIAGEPRPSFFRIIKTALVALIRAARPERDAAVEAHRARTAERLASLRQCKWLPAPRRKRLVEPLAVPHAELSASPRPYGGASTKARPVRSPQNPPVKEEEPMPKYSLSRRPPSSITAEDLQALNLRRRKAGLPPWQWSVDRWRYEEEDLGLPPAPPLHVSEAKAAAGFIARGAAVPAALAARIRRDVAASALLLEMTGVQL